MHRHRNNWREAFQVERRASAKARGRDIFGRQAVWLEGMNKGGIYMKNKYKDVTGAQILQSLVNLCQGSWIPHSVSCKTMKGLWVEQGRDLAYDLNDHCACPMRNRIQADKGGDLLQEPGGETVVPWIRTKAVYGMWRDQIGVFQR